jgi:hypothetical protein
LGGLRVVFAAFVSETMPPRFYGEPNIGSYFQW